MQKRYIIQPVFPRAFFLTVSQGHVYACLVLPMALKSVKAFVHSALAPLVFSCTILRVLLRNKSKTTWRSSSWVLHQQWTSTSVTRSSSQSLRFQFGLRLIRPSPRLCPGTVLDSKWQRSKPCCRQLPVPGVADRAVHRQSSRGVQIPDARSQGQTQAPQQSADGPGSGHRPQPQPQPQ